MSEKCPYCGKVFENTKALGSHIHYSHETESWASMSQNRSEDNKQRFQELLDSCIIERGLPRPRRTDKIEQVVTQIPEGISPTIDQYRQAYRCAVDKEKLIKEFEEDLIQEASEEKK